MLIYGVSVAMILAYLGMVEGMTGVMLWPAVVLHLILSAFLARAAFNRTTG